MIPREEPVTGVDGRQEIGQQAVGDPHQCWLPSTRRYSRSRSMMRLDECPLRNASTSYVAAIGENGFAACNFFGLVVASFDQDVGQDFRDDPLWRVFRKWYDPVDRCQTGQHEHPILECIDGPGLTLQSSD